MCEYCEYGEYEDGCVYGNDERSGEDKTRRPRRGGRDGRDGKDGRGEGVNDGGLDNNSGNEIDIGTLTPLLWCPSGKL